MMESGDFETPAKMALSVAMSASSNSSGKEILQRYRDLVAKKSAERNLDKTQSKGNAPSNGTHPSLDPSSDTTSSNHNSTPDPILLQGTNLTRDIQIEKKNNVDGDGNGNGDPPKKINKTFDNRSSIDGDSGGSSNKENRDPSRSIKERMKRSKFKLRDSKPLEAKSVSAVANAANASSVSVPVSVPASGRNQTLVRDKEQKRQAQVKELPNQKQHPPVPSIIQPEATDASSPLSSTISFPSPRRNFSTIESEESIWAMVGGATDPVPLNEAIMDGTRDYATQRDGEELLSLLDTSSCVSSNTRTTKDDISQDSRTLTASPLPLENTPHKHIQSTPLPPGSVQTFTIGGRSYTIDISTPWKSMISSGIDVNTPGLATQNSLETNSRRGNTVVPEVSVGESTVNFEGSTVNSSHFSVPKFASVEVHNGNSNTSPNSRLSFPDLATKANTASTQAEELSKENDEYLKKIADLSYALGVAESEKEKEKQKREKCEKHIQELLHQNNAPDEDSSICRNISVVPGSFEEEDSVFTGRGESRETSKSPTSSLIERNKTLVKEVRFADQTCVELSERNSAMERDIQRLEEDMDEIRQENESLHDAVVRSTQHSAKMEHERDALAMQMTEQKARYEMQLRDLADKVENSEQRVESLTEKLEQSQSDKTSIEMKLVATSAKYDTLLRDYSEAKEHVTALSGRVAASNSASEVSAASAAASYREFCDEMQTKVNDLQQLCDHRLDLLNSEQERRKVIVEECADLKDKCRKLETQFESYSKKRPETGSVLETPKKEVTQTSSIRTPTSTVLAKTLQVELERGHHAMERILESEKTARESQSKLLTMSRELDEAKADANYLRERLRDGIRFINASCSSGANNFQDTAMIQDDAISLESQSEYDEAKKEFDLALSRIQKIQDEADTGSQFDEDMIHSALLSVVQKMANASKDLSEEAETKLSMYSERILQLTQIVSDLSQNHNLSVDFDDVGSINVDISDYSIEKNPSSPESKLNATISSKDAGYQVSEKSLLMMEEGTPRLGTQEEDVSQTKTTPESESSVPHEEDPVSNSCDDNVSNEIAKLKEEIQVCNEKLHAADAEKESLSTALGDTCEKLEALSENFEQLQSKYNKETENHLETISELESMLKQSERGLQEALESAENAVQLHSSEREDFEEKIIELQSELRDYEESLQHSEDDCACANQELEKACLDIDLLNDRISVVEEEQVRLEERYQTSLNSLHDAETECKELKKQLNEVKSVEDREKKELSARIKNLEDDLSHCHGDKNTFSQQIKVLDNDLSRQREEYNVIKNHCIDMEKQLEQMNEEKAQDRRVVEELRGALHQANEEAENLKMSYVSCNDRLADEVEKNTHLQKVCNHLEDDKSSLEEEIENASKDLTEKMLLIDSLEKEINELQSVLRKKGEEISKKENEFDAMKQAHKIELSNERDKLYKVQNDLKDAQHDAEVSTKKLGENIQLMTTLESKVKSTLQDYEVLKAKHSADVGHKETELKSTVNELHKKNQLLKDKEESLSVLSGLHDDTIKEMESMKLDLSRKEEDIERSVDQITELGVRNESLERKCVRLREYIKKLTQKCEDWAESYRKQQLALQEFEQDQQNALKKISHLNNEKRETNMKNKSLETNICQECSYLRKTIARESSLVSTLKRENELKNSQIKSLSKKLDRSMVEQEQTQSSGSPWHELKSLTSSGRRSVVLTQPKGSFTSNIHLSKSKETQY